MKCPGPGDWLMTVTQVFFTGYCACYVGEYIPVLVRLVQLRQPQELRNAHHARPMRKLACH